MTTELTKGEAK